MTNITSQPHKSGFKYLEKREKLGRRSCKKFPFASFHKCVIGGWCLTPRRQVFVFPFLKPKVGLFRFSQADYSHGPAPEGEKIIISVSPARPRPRLRPRTRPKHNTRTRPRPRPRVLGLCGAPPNPASPTKAVKKNHPCVDLQSSSKWLLVIMTRPFTLNTLAC